MKIFLTTLCLLAGLQLNAQGSMFWNDYAILNPSLSAFKYKHQGYLTYKNGANSILQSLVANYSGKIEKFNLGVGFNYTGFDLPGQVGNNILGNMSYSIPSGDKNFFKLGVGGGLVSQRVNGNYYVDSATVASRLYNVKQYVLDLGLSFVTEKLMLGVSTLNLNEPEFISEDSLVNIVQNRVIAALGEYRLNLSEKLQLIPRVMYQYQAEGFHNVMVNAQLAYNEKYMLGVGYDFNNLFIVNLNWDVKGKYRAGYSFDIVNNKLGNNTFNHEAVLGILIQEGKKKTKGLLK